MNLERYDYFANETFLDFEFESVGPKGKVRKIVRFSQQKANGLIYFNLGFGDLNMKTSKIDDLTITDNKDRDKILATIAATIMDFTLHFPDALVYATGSTPSRSRLYQMAISAHNNEIESYFDIFGLVKGNWESFSRNVNYEAFFVIRKKL